MAPPVKEGICSFALWATSTKQSSLTALTEDFFNDCPFHTVCRCSALKVLASRNLTPPKFSCNIVLHGPR